MNREEYLDIIGHEFLYKKSSSPSAIPQQYVSTIKSFFNALPKYGEPFYKSYYGRIPDIKVVLIDSPSLYASVKEFNPSEYLISIPYGLLQRVRVFFWFISLNWNDWVQNGRVHKIQAPHYNFSPERSSIVKDVGCELKGLFIEYENVTELEKALDEIISNHLVGDERHIAGIEEDIEQVTYNAATFMALHELGHIIKGHFKCVDLIIDKNQKNESFSEIEFLKGIELEADAFACRQSWGMMINSISSHRYNSSKNSKEYFSYIDRGIMHLVSGIFCLFSSFDIDKKYWTQYDEDIYIHPAIRYELACTVISTFVKKSAQWMHKAWLDIEYETFMRCLTSINKLSLEFECLSPLTSITYGANKNFIEVYKNEYNKSISIVTRSMELTSEELIRLTNDKLNEQS